MNPLLAAVLVVLATAGSVTLIAYVHGQERHRAFTTPELIVLVVWFLATYGFMAFVVVPH